MTLCLTAPINSSLTNFDSIFPSFIQLSYFEMLISPSGIRERGTNKKKNWPAASQSFIKKCHISKFEHLLLAGTILGIVGVQTINRKLFWQWMGGTWIISCIVILDGDVEQRFLNNSTESLGAGWAKQCVQQSLRRVEILTHVSNWLSNLTSCLFCRTLEWLTGI